MMMTTTITTVLLLLLLPLLLHMYQTKSPAIARVELTVLVVTDLEGHPRSMIVI